MTGRRNACPGLSSPMATGDGLLVRFVPVGPIGIDAFRAFCAAARQHGNGVIEITARGSVQVRGLSERSAEEFAAAIATLGIAADGVPVVATALGDEPDALIAAEALAAELRKAIGDLALELAEQGLALAPKISVVVDGGGKLHLDAVAADIRLRAIATPDGTRLCIGIAGDDASATWLGTVTPGTACAVVVTLLRAIATIGPAARARDLIGTAGGIASTFWSASKIGPGTNPSAEGGGWSAYARWDSPSLGHPPPSGEELRYGPAPKCVLPSLERALRPPVEPIGPHRLRDGTVALGVALAFGLADAERLAELAEIAAEHGAGSLRPAAGRALLVIGIPPDRASSLARCAAGLGFIVRPDDPRRRIAACPGAPACSSALMPARELAAAVGEMLANRFREPDQNIAAAETQGPNPAALAGREDFKGPHPQELAPDERLEGWKLAPTSPVAVLRDGEGPCGALASSGQGLIGTIHLSGCRKGCAHPKAAAITVVGTGQGCEIIRNGTVRGRPDRRVESAELLSAIMAEAATSDHVAGVADLAKVAEVDRGIVAPLEAVDG